MCCRAPAGACPVLPSQQHSRRCPELPLEPCRARAHSAGSGLSAACCWLWFWLGEGERSVSVGSDSFFLTCGYPNWWVSCIPAPSPLADGAGISESAGEQGQLCQCFDTVGGELKAELPVKCSDQKKCLCLTWIPVFFEGLNSWHIPQAWEDHKGLGVWGDAGTIPVLGRLGKEM